MLSSRIIPCLLLQGQGLVKTIGFKDPKYVGDPINAIRIFNTKEVDELVLLDISATPENRGPAWKQIAEVAGECFMPLCYGGGVQTMQDVEKIFSLGVEKVALNTAAFSKPDLVREAVKAFGGQSIVASIDVKKNWLGKSEVYTQAGRKGTKLDPVSYARRMEDLGVGEIFLNSIDRDGTMQGYDIPLIKSVTRAVGVPVVACGGAGQNADFSAAIFQGGASAAAAGSLFVFKGKHRAVLITYPGSDELKQLLSAPSPASLPA